MTHRDGLRVVPLETGHRTDQDAELL
jgi:hypothetical protein